ncbi:sensory box protein [Paraburkholderia xenovorans LB400]|uniref:PAS/PAC sensor signal transduction histidine kinase n=1 Tax=Paraburkholderia xenovorans (strain LB400) TaxID=266265 RepID=Q13H12_PARXL|nr:PAS domain-containing sensor histidine kinase [Paraburkholderia xenovorans]ABE36627.1 PAS/PAC sensor signal transduction histidine kinase [Paraburkholderia xenovorans LB400]AIP34144.1 sensory box protein [Paraburkholderia xenovorans LB400]
MKDEVDPARSGIVSSRPHFPSDESFRLLVEAVDDYAIYMLDMSGKVVNWNAGAQRMKGYYADEIIGQHFRVFHTPEDIAAGQPDSLLAAAAADGRVASQGWRVRKDGSKFRANVVVSAIRTASGELCGFAKVTQDLTEQNRLAEFEQLRRLATHIQATREEEQIRIARELHDDLGQQLAALKMALADLETILRDNGAIAALTLTHTKDMHHLIDVTVASLRRIAAGLRPIVLETLGLVPALEWLIGDFTQRYHIDVNARIQTDDMNVSEAASEALFHIIQEALTNVARHAHADEVTVELARGGRTCVLRVEDNGQGMASATLPRETSFGLLGMRERVHRLNGSLSIDSTPGCGFRIAITFPLETLERVPPGRPGTSAPSVSPSY